MMPTVDSGSPPAPFQPGRWPVTRGAYHADRECDCHSSMEAFFRSIPLYHAIFVTGELAAPGPSPAMEFGTAFHTYILEPAKFTAEIVVQATRFDMRTTVGKASYAAFQEEARGRVVILQDQFDSLRRMADSVMGNKAARELLELPGEVEQAIRWRDPDTGLPLRSLLDKMISSGPTVDLKTALDPTPEGWSKAAANFGYHRQAALYQAGRCEALEQEPEPFYFIVVGKELPHEAIVYELDSKSMNLGISHNCAVLDELRDCKDFDRWSSRHADQVLNIALPRWAFYA